MLKNESTKQFIIVFTREPFKHKDRELLQQLRQRNDGSAEQLIGFMLLRSMFSLLPNESREILLSTNATLSVYLPGPAPNTCDLVVRERHVARTEKEVVLGDSVAALPVLQTEGIPKPL